MTILQTRPLFLIVVATLVTTCVFSTEAWADTEEAYKSRAKRLYDFARWGGKTKSEYTRLVSIPKDVQINAIPDTVSVEVVSDQELANGYLLDRWYRLSLRDKTGRNVLVKLRLVEGKSIMHAHDAMISFLSVVAAKKLRSGTSVGLSVGDVCFVGWGKPIISLTFCRNNIFVRIRSMETNVSVVDMGKFVDKAILKASFRKKSATTSKRGDANNQLSDLDRLRHMEAKRVLALKKALQFEKLPKTGRIRAASGFSPGVFKALGDFEVKHRGISPSFAHGMAKQLMLVGPKDTPQIGVTIFVGMSARNAQEMLVRQMTITSMPIEMMTAVHVTKGRPGDFHIVQKTGKERTARSIVRFVRDNIALTVEARTGDYDVFPIARKLDIQIQKMKVLSKGQYDRALPKAEIVSVEPPAPVEGEWVTIRYQTASELPQGIDIAVIPEPPGLALRLAKETKDAVTFVTKMAGRTYVGLVVYDKDTLLSRWTTFDLSIR